MKQNSLLLLIWVSLALTQGDLDSTQSCMVCHTKNSWSQRPDSPSFDHGLDTRFPLTFLHVDLNCNQCHPGSNLEEFHQFKTPGSTCVDCHQDIHQNYWGNACADCHTPESWDPDLTYRNHELTLMPLIASHRNVDCYFCHTSPTSLPSIDCQDCHDLDFLPALEAHASVNARTDCSTCHAPTRWNQILAINHKIFFPIYSGEHFGRWSDCGTCHTQSGDYQSFTCFGSGCHSISKMNSEHCEGSSCERCGSDIYPSSGVQPEDCYSCHPQGNKNKCGD